jgi:hypothetical protein
MPKSKPNSRAEHSFLTSGANRDDQTRGVERPLVTERVDSATQLRMHVIDTKAAAIRIYSA